jgi:glucan phosphoethanolaminetransferase (alkaline phosphatase superfamily)
MEFLLLIGLFFVVYIAYAWIVSTDHERKQMKRDWNGCLFLLVVGAVFFFIASLQ